MFLLGTENVVESAFAWSSQSGSPVRSSQLDPPLNTAVPANLWSSQLSSQLGPLLLTQQKNGPSDSRTRGGATAPTDLAM